jgi:hypothetical protein
MRRSIITPLLVVLLLQLLVAGGLLLRRNPLAGSRSDTPLLNADAIKNADQLVIDSKPASAAKSEASGGGSEPTRVVLRKKDGAWVLADSFDVPADTSKVNSLLTRLGGLKRGLPIATSEAALKRFKVVDSDFERRLVLSAGGKSIETVYLGSSPGLRKSDARTADERAVYAVDLPTYELPTDFAAWVSGDLIRTDLSKLAEVDVADGGRDTLQLVRQKGTDKQPDSWNDPALKGDQRIDSAHAESLLQQVADVRVDGVLGTAAEPQWQQDHPALTLTLKDDKAQPVVWTLSKPASGDYYVLKSSSQPWYFSISSATGKQVIDDAGRNALVVAAKPSPATAGKT